MFEGLLQPTHLIVMLAMALLVFGPRKLTELGKGLGRPALSGVFCQRTDSACAVD